MNRLSIQEELIRAYRLAGEPSVGYDYMNDTPENYAIRKVKATLEQVWDRLGFGPPLRFVVSSTQEAPTEASSPNGPQPDSSSHEDRLRKIEAKLNSLTEFCYQRFGELLFEE